MICLRDITRYDEKERRRALSGICLKLEKGDMVALTGESGAGKSALLHIIAMLDYGTRGEYRYRGENVFSAEKARRTGWRSEMGVFLQEKTLIPQKTVYENLALPLYYRRVRRQEIRERVLSIAGRLELTPLLAFRPRALSPEQYAEAEIARAIITNPSLLLLDAPAEEMGEERRAAMLRRLQEWNLEGLTIVLTTRNATTAGYCRRIVTLCEGRVAGDFRID